MEISINNDVSVIVNVIIACINLLLNIFFLHCLAVSPEKIKQPLKALLVLLITSSVSYLASMLTKIVLDLHWKSLVFNMVLYVMTNSSLATSLTSSVWLNIFYYTQIVPPKKAFAVWMKKNIKSVIFSALVFERPWFLIDLAFDLLSIKAKIDFFDEKNGTISLDITASHNLSLYAYLKWILGIYVILSACMMALSNASISCYLIQHIRRMSTKGQYLSCPKLRGQLRVAVTGITQGVLHLFSALWVVLGLVGFQMDITYLDFYVNITVINVYMFCTTLNMWAGQSVFRQRTVQIIQDLKGRLLAGTVKT